MRGGTGPLLWAAVVGATAACTSCTPGAPVTTDPPQSPPASASATPSAPSGTSPVPSTVEAVDLATVAKENPLVLKDNVRELALMKVKADNRCTRAVGLSASEAMKARRLLYFTCSETGYEYLAPARILPDSTTAEQALRASLRGPNEREVQAGFEPNEAGMSAGSPVRMQVVDGVLIIDMLATQPHWLSHQEHGVRPLEASVAKAAEVGKVSFLIQHVPQCRVADVC